MCARFEQVQTCLVVDMTFAQFRQQLTQVFVNLFVNAADAIEAAGRGGGLVIACSNVVPPGASLENVRALREAVRVWGS